MSDKVKKPETVDELPPAPLVEPTVYSVLYGQQTLELRDRVKEIADRENAMAAESIARWVTGQIQQAYVRGVCDGFATGVAKATDELVEGTNLTLLYNHEEREEADHHESLKALQGFFWIAFGLALFAFSLGVAVAGLVQLFSWGYGLVV